jgi:hypothetical protein
MHHGHLQGYCRAQTSAKETADGAPRASRPGTATRTPPPTQHTSAQSPARCGRAWPRHPWEDATGESLDVSSPRLTVLGLRPTPPQTDPPPDKALHKATEPAWRLLHAVALFHIYKACKPECTWHTTPSTARTTPSAPRLSTYLLRAIKQRVAARVQYEHD